MSTSAETKPTQRTEEPLWQTTRKRLKWIALTILGICTLCMMSGIGLLTLGVTLWGVILLVVAIVLLLLGIYLNAAGRFIRYTDGSTEWEWEKKERLKRDSE